MNRCRPRPAEWCGPSPSAGRTHARRRCRLPAPAHRRGQALRLLHGQPRHHAIGRGDHHVLCARTAAARSAASRVRTPQSAPGMWPSRKSMLRARSTTTVPSPLSSSATSPVDVDRRHRRAEFRHRQALARRGAERLQPAFHHEHVAMAHLAQPCAGHAGAHAGIVHQHDAGVAHADPLVGRLHQLPARRADAAGPGDRRGIRRGRARPAHTACGRRRPRSGRGRSAPITPTPEPSAKAWARCRAVGSVFGRAGGEAVGAAAVAAEPGQLPAHRAVAQRHHLVGDAGAAQAFGAHDAAGPAGAVHHHQRLRIGHEVADPVDQFAAGNADRRSGSTCARTPRACGCRAPPCCGPTSIHACSSAASTLSVP